MGGPFALCLRAGILFYFFYVLSNSKLRRWKSDSPSLTLALDSRQSRFLHPSPAESRTKINYTIWACLFEGTFLGGSKKHESRINPSIHFMEDKGLNSKA